MLESVGKALNELDQNDLSLSKVMPRVIQIAKRSQDPFNYLLFILVNEANKRISESLELQVKEMALKNHRNEEEAKEIRNKAVRKSIILKRIDSIYDFKTKKFLDDQVIAYSIVELEEEIISLRDRLNRNSTLEGLHTLDAFYFRENEEQLKSILGNFLNAYKKVYARIKEYVRTYLVNIEDGLSSSKVITKKEVESKMNKNVFIIHGHNEAKWRELSHLLSSEFNAIPIVLSEQANLGGSTIIEKFEKYANECSYAFAIFTPDDTINKDGESFLQARPNVIFELGWFYGKLGRERVCLILQEADNMKIYSDLDGVMQLRFRNSIDELFRPIREELRSAGLYE